MSNSDKDDKKDSKVIDPPLASTTTYESEDSASTCPIHNDFEIKKHGIIINDHQLVDHYQKQQRSSAVVDDEDDGFRTPTALEHKIPVIAKCPSTPRKNRLSRKRKLESPFYRSAANLILDMSKEIELFFPQDKLDEELKRKMKIARKQMLRMDDHSDDALT